MPFVSYLFFPPVFHLKVTTKKRETLILNVDGCIAACFVDLLRSCGAFTQEEVRAHKGNMGFTVPIYIGIWLEGIFYSYAEETKPRKPCAVIFFNVRGSKVTLPLLIESSRFHRTNTYRRMN